MPTLDFHLDSLGDDSGDTIGGRLTLARDAAHLRLDIAARRLGVDRQTLHDWESDRDAPPQADLLELAAILDVSPMWLSAGIGEGPVVRDEDEALDVLERRLALLRRVLAESERLLERLEIRIDGLNRHGRRAE